MDVTFSFSDTIAGYVVTTDKAAGTFTLKTSDGRDYPVLIAPASYAELVRNLGESYADCTGQMKEMLVPGRYLYAYGTFYPEAGKPFEAKHLIFVGRGEREFVT